MFKDKGKPVSRRNRPCEQLRLWLGMILGVLLLIGLPGHIDPATYEPAAAPAIGSQVAIADLDGDIRPDFATVGAGLDRSGNTNYWIQLQLSAAGRQSIRL